jgi:peptidylprolyl isomerase
MLKLMFALPLLGFASVAAGAQAPVAPATPVAPAASALPINPPTALAADPANRWTLELSNGGRVVILLRPDAAPLMVERIRQLTSQGAYNGLTFHRVIPGFMAQGGDPKGDGTGGSALPDLKAEFNSLPHLRGTVAAARSESPDSANSQFYIMFAPKISLDGKYTVFGRVIEGMTFVDQITPGEPPATPTRITRTYIGASATDTSLAPKPEPEAPPEQAPSGG